MFSRRLVFFVVFDLVGVLLLLLLSVYFGVSHLFVLALGAVILYLTVYELRTRRLSATLALLFDLPEGPATGAFNWVPLVLSLGLILYGILQLVEHGPVNAAQRYAMQQSGVFPPFALRTILGAGAVILAAVITTLRSRRK